jgi:hypothetical protein
MNLDETENTFDADLEGDFLLQMQDKASRRKSE